MSMFDHPNLIRFFGVVQEDAQLNIFVEWMPGGSVSKLLDKHGSFNDNVILKYTYQILQGLDYLHHHGILHRDLKGNLPTLICIKGHSQTTSTDFGPFWTSLPYWFTVLLSKIYRVYLVTLASHYSPSPCVKRSL